jgi:AcrR family transcriptional regulator
MEPAVRERLLENALLELEQRGREGIAVEQLLARSGVEEDDFLATFGDLDGCLDDAYEELTAKLVRVARESCEGAPDPSRLERNRWPGRVRHGLEALLAHLAARPRLATALTRAYPSLGSPQQARYHRFVARFEPMLAPGRRFAGADVELPRNVEALAVGAAEAIVFDRIQAGEADELEQHAPSILFSVLVPFLGPEAAGTELAKAQQARVDTDL